MKSLLLRAGGLVRSFPARGPVLRYVEIHLTDHSNLNCRGCGHFSPVATQWFAGLGRLSADLVRLSQLFSNIETIRLMGGEPLLHAGAAEAMAIARRSFPRAGIRLVTNGILLPRVSQDFWQACKNNEVTVDVTRYPIPLDFAAIRRLAEQNGVRIAISAECGGSVSFLNLKGDSDPCTTMRNCRSQWYCPFLQDGVLHVCAMPATVHYFNDRFSTAIPSEGGIDIHARGVTGRRILSWLERPAPACRYCRTEYGTFPWAPSKREIGKWEA
jgi:hypothetical protein